MSPECGNCGHHVTPHYERVATRRGEDGVECCPFCPDRIRSDGAIRTARADRTQAHGVAAGEGDVPAKGEGDD